MLRGVESTTIRLSRQLHDRLAQRAKAEQTTLAGAIEHALDAEENAKFWSRAAATMGSRDAQHPARRESDDLPGTLRDGLDPAETWDDIW
jgi:predicted transcriptional regulator